MAMYSNIDFVLPSRFVIDGISDEAPSLNSLYLVPREFVRTETFFKGRTTGWLDDRGRIDTRYDYPASIDVEEKYTQLTADNPAWTTAVTLASRFGSGDGRKGHVHVAVNIIRVVIEGGSRYLVSIIVTLHDGRVVTAVVSGTVTYTVPQKWEVVDQHSDLYNVGVTPAPTGTIVNILDAEFKARVVLSAQPFGIVTIEEFVLSVPKLSAQTSV